MGVLDDIRHAAFELRQTDPQEAIRVLRRAAQQGGEAEVLARGALGEIYLDELGDLDGAEHEFRRVLQLAPGLSAAEIGLGRTRRESGDVKGAEEAFGAARAAFLTGGNRGREGQALISLAHVAVSASPASRVIAGSIASGAPATRKTPPSRAEPPVAAAAASPVAATFPRAY